MEDIHNYNVAGPRTLPPVTTGIWGPETYKGRTTVIDMQLALLYVFEWLPKI